MEEGTVVISNAGRDKGKFMVVLSTENQFVFVADGKERPVGRPKKKCLKHIKRTNFKLDSESYAFDIRLRKAICNLQMSSQKEELDLG